MSTSARLTPPHPLPLPLGGTHTMLDTTSGPVAVYSINTLETDSRPLLLLHSVNAAACAYEVKPLYDHYGSLRPTYAFDLPGFGLSDRSDRPYTIRLMTDALLAVLAHIRDQHGGMPVDVVGVSLSCEYVARAALEKPSAVARIALVSPTGFVGRKRSYGAPGSSRGIEWARRLVSHPAWSNWLFNNLTRPGVIRFFLQRTFGSKTIDEGLWQCDLLTTRQPGARHLRRDVLGPCCPSPRESREVLAPADGHWPTLPTTGGATSATETPSLNTCAIRTTPPLQTDL